MTYLGTICLYDCLLVFFFELTLISASKMYLLKEEKRELCLLIHSVTLIQQFHFQAFIPQTFTKPSTNSTRNIPTFFHCNTIYYSQNLEKNPSVPKQKKNEYKNVSV